MMKNQLLNKYRIVSVTEVVYELDVHADSAEEAHAIASAMCERKQTQLHGLNFRVGKFTRVQTNLVFESKFNKSKKK